MDINQTQSEIIEEFAQLSEWMDKYAYIIELGNTLAPYPEEKKTAAHLIEGCQSRVWIDAETDQQGRVVFTADSDALIVKGIIALLLRVLSGRTPHEILNADLHFIDDIGLAQHLSPTRSNGLLAMLKQIKLYARAFQVISEGDNK